MIFLYIDPGFGSLFIQGLFTVAVGISFYFNKVKTILGFSPQKAKTSEELNEKIEIR